MAEMRKRLLVALALCVVLCQSWALAQTLGSAPQFNKAVQGQTGAQPEGAFMNIINWVGNVIAPVGAAAAVVGGIVHYAMGRAALRWFATAACWSWSNRMNTFRGGVTPATGLKSPSCAVVSIR